MRLEQHPILEFHRGRRITTQSIVMRSRSGTVRMVEAEHLASKWEKYARH